MLTRVHAERQLWKPADDGDKVDQRRGLTDAPGVHDDVDFFLAIVLFCQTCARKGYAGA